MQGLAYSLSFWVAVAVLVVAYQGYVSFVVVQAPWVSRFQKVMQCLLVWLLPVVGAVVVHWFATHGVATLPVADREFVPQERPTLGQR